MFAICLGDGLRNCQKLQTLDLQGNKIGNEGAIAIADGLIHRFQNTTLKTLNLSKNRIGDEGGRQMALMLQVNKSLTELNLASNNLSEASGEHFVTAMAKNMTLLTLNVECNLLTLSQLNSLAEQLQRNLLHFKSQALVP